MVVADLDEAVPRYSRLFGATFHPTGEAVAKNFGVRVAAAWDVGIELVQPIRDSPVPNAQYMLDLLNSRGESVCGAAFVVDDMKAAIDTAQAEGLEPYAPTTHFTEQQIEEEFAGKFRRFDETAFDSIGKMGFCLVFNVLEEKK